MQQLLYNNNSRLVIIIKKLPSLSKEGNEFRLRKKGVLNPPSQTLFETPPFNKGRNP